MGFPFNFFQHVFTSFNEFIIGQEKQLEIEENSYSEISFTGNVNNSLPIDKPQVVFSFSGSLYPHNRDFGTAEVNLSGRFTGVPFDNVSDVFSFSGLVSPSFLDIPPFFIQWSGNFSSTLLEITQNQFYWSGNINSYPYDKTYSSFSFSSSLLKYPSSAISLEGILFNGSFSGDRVLFTGTVEDILYLEGGIFTGVYTSPLA